MDPLSLLIIFFVSVFVGVITSMLGIAEVIHHAPVIGKRQRFLPGYCMLNLSHTAVVNMVLKKRGVSTSD